LLFDILKDQDKYGGHRSTKTDYIKRV